MRDQKSKKTQNSTLSSLPSVYLLRGNNKETREGSIKNENSYKVGTTIKMRKSTHLKVILIHSIRVGYDTLFPIKLIAIFAVGDIGGQLLPETNFVDCV